MTAQNAIVETAYHLEIYGWAWGGFKSCYQYSVPSEMVDSENVKTFAPDFESVIDWRLVKAEHRYENAGNGLTRRSDTYRTLRGFRNGMRPRRFHRLVNGF